MSSAKNCTRQLSGSIWWYLHGNWGENISPFRVLFLSFFSPLRAIDFFYRTFHISYTISSYICGFYVWNFSWARISLSIHLSSFARCDAEPEMMTRRRFFTIINCILRENAIKSRHITVISSCLLSAFLHTSFASRRAKTTKSSAKHERRTTSLRSVRNQSFLRPDSYSWERGLLRHVNGKQRTRTEMLPSQELLHLHEQT
jgi:hypothetical protein